MARASLQDMTNAAIAYLESNQKVQALDVACRTLLQYGQTGHIQRLVFAIASEQTTIPAMAADLKKATEIVLGYNDIENQRLFAGWFYIFKSFPLFQPFWEENPDWKKIEPLLNDKFLVEGVRKLNFLDWELERIFTQLRRDLLLTHYPAGALKTKHLPFLCALAEHCFYNEYVFAVDAVELEALEKIDPADPVSVALIGCYKPLTDVTFDEKMSAVAGFRSMVKTHVGNVRDERAIEFESGTGNSGDVTKNVQAMYEENSYPRWFAVNMPHIQIKDIEGDILLAGCGTGQTALPFSAALPNCNFTAIDISRASLAYAMRMTQAHGIDNISFTHMDIMHADTLEETFDYIECSGVLHHMEDPEAGWRSLVSCLKPGGGMQIALYSKKARVSIDAVRQYIKEKSYRPVPDDIRKLRADIAALPDGDPRKDVLRMRDFYSVSMVRDLVFHIQEKCYDLPEIASMMDRLGLSFDGFKIHEGIKALYRARFTDDPSITNLDNWNIFETENPDTFAGMYRIFCHKKDETVSDTVKRIRQMQA